jgi:23S rRNA pseudouridine1911/1915/1917 synthase
VATGDLRLEPENFDDDPDLETIQEGTHIVNLEPASRVEEPRLDQWLYGQLDAIPSRSFAHSLITTGRVAVERQGRVLKAKPSLRLRAFDTVRVNLVWPESPTSVDPEPMDLRVVFEDDDILVINKPPGLVVHPGAGSPSGTLVNGLLAYLGTGIPSLGGRVRAGLVHRLDRDTSGVMITAKSDRALSSLGASFRNHTHVRQYHAVVYGTPNPKEMTLETGHVRHPNARTRFTTAPMGTGKRACTHVKVLETFSSGSFSLVECTLETGRTHQIRVHLESINHPIVGDPVYGNPPSRAAHDGLSTSYPHARAWIRKNVSRQLLHAVTLGIRHPVTGESILFSSPYEQDMTDCLSFLRNLDGSRSCRT